jgi:cyclopropane fatty-acyl-phospholipid synthase-like methyltransferase
MAVAFMEALEQMPETYDVEFDVVLDGRASKIREQILTLIQPGMKVLDLGCGTGLLSIEAARKGAHVIAVDANENMLKVAHHRADDINPRPSFVKANAIDVGELIEVRLAEMAPGEASQVRKAIEGEFDLIVSTFLLSELRPVQRHLFFQRIRNLLKKDGKFAIASEVLPKHKHERKEFWRKRNEAEKLAGMHIRLSKKHLQPPIIDLKSLVESAGLVIDSATKLGSEISFIIGHRSDELLESEFQNRTLSFFGPKARGRIWYNHLTGGWRSIPIEPGLYRAGSPTADSPVIVTANYELTYYTVMRALARDGIDAWVLVCDSNGINVWCAARGTHFHTDEVVNMVHLTRLAEIVNHRELILPQLSAAGMNPTEIRARTGFRSRYGPVRIHDLSQWFSLNKPRPKPKEMATVTFNLRERMEQAVAHIPFLMANLLFKPLAMIVGLLLVASIISVVLFPIIAPITLSFTGAALFFIGEFLVALFGYSFFLGLVFPILPSKGNSFWSRGLGLAAITMPIGAVIMILLSSYWTVIITWLTIQFILSTNLTLDWSGMTSISDPKVIRKEYPYMILTLIIGAIFLVTFNILAFLFAW